MRTLCWADTTTPPAGRMSPVSCALRFLIVKLSFFVAHASSGKNAVHTHTPRYRVHGAAAQLVAHRGTMLLVRVDDGVDALLDELTSLRASRSSRTRCGLTSGSRSSTAPSCGRSWWGSAAGAASSLCLKRSVPRRPQKGRRRRHEVAATRGRRGPRASERGHERRAA